MSSFTSGLYLAALKAAATMATLLDDAAFAEECARRFDTGVVKLDEELWDGDWYIQKPDPEKSSDMQYGTGCHSDQLLGQWWAHTLDIGYVFPEPHVKTALRSISRYNFREHFFGFAQTPRVFASEHDSGVLICTWPKGGKPEKPTLYSDEIWPGIEYPVASLMLREGMVEDAFKIVLAARGRYDGIQRNPWNEVECGDHYARAMASWGVYLALAGFEHHGPRGHLGFAPRLTPEHFRAAFTTAEGWGTFQQDRDDNGQREQIDVRWGTLRLKSLAFAVPEKLRAAPVKVVAAGKDVEAKATFKDKPVQLELGEEVALNEGEILEVRFGNGVFVELG